jgi:hypothetical protein
LKGKRVKVERLKVERVKMERVKVERVKVERPPPALPQRRGSPPALRRWWLVGWSGMTAATPCQPACCQRDPLAAGSGEESLHQ